MQSILADEGHQRNLRDFLLLYNQLTESCFNQCVINLNYRNVTTEEADCLAACSDRYVAYNQRLMSTFMENQTARQQASVLEAQEQEAIKKASQNKVEKVEQPADSLQTSDISTANLKGGSNIAGNTQQTQLNS